MPSLISHARNIFGTNIFETAVNMDFKLFYISLQNSGHINESSRSPHCIRDKPFSFSYPPRFARLGYENSKGLSRIQFGARELSNKIPLLGEVSVKMYLSLSKNISGCSSRKYFVNAFGEVSTINLQDPTPI